MSTACGKAQVWPMQSWIFDGLETATEILVEALYGTTNVKVLIGVSRRELSADLTSSPSKPEPELRGRSPDTRD